MLSFAELLHSICGRLARRLLLPLLAFTFFLVWWCGLFALVVVIVASGDASAFGVAEPWIFTRTVTASFHVSRVCDVSLLERQSALVSIAAWLNSARRYFTAIPSLERRQFFVLLRVGYPLKGLRRRYKPHVGPEKSGGFVMNP